MKFEFNLCSGFTGENVDIQTTETQESLVYY